MQLRKMTRLSLVKFGKYSDLTVGNLLEIKKIGYLLWMYYCNSHITFFDDILDELKIAEYNRITKPGKDENLYNEIMRQRFARLKDSNDGLKLRSHVLRVRKNEAGRKLQLMKNDKRFIKCSLQWKNQGH